MTAPCATCRGKGWVQHRGWPQECPECCPTKIVRGKVTLDKAALAAKARRQEDKAPPVRRGFVLPPPFVDDRSPHERCYDGD